MAVLFIADVEHDIDYIDGSKVLWVNKDDCIEWAFLQYSAIADLWASFFHKA